MAIITVLAAVAIPTFGRQLETAREANDAEAIRAAATDAFTEVYAKYVTVGAGEDNANLTATAIPVTLKQQTEGFQYLTPTITIGSTTATLGSGTKFSATTYTAGSANVVFTFDLDATNNGIKLKSIAIGGGTAVNAT